MIERLEEIAAKAKTGEVVGMVAAVVEHDGECRFLVGGLAASFPNLAEDMAKRLLRRILKRLH